MSQKRDARPGISFAYCRKTRRNNGDTVDGRIQEPGSTARFFVTPYGVWHTVAVSDHTRKRPRSTAQSSLSGLPARLLEAARRKGFEKQLVEWHLVIAVSGGADSLALLYALRELRGQEAAASLHVAHLDHGFRGEESTSDARFVEEAARSLGLPVTITKFDVPAYAKRCGLSPEDAARKARYHILAGVCAEKGFEAVAVGHTADDQAETVMLHLIRGSGLGGLAGMKMLTTVPVEPSLETCPGRTGSGGRLAVYRPLLSTSRREVEEYCELKGLSPRADSSNRSAAYRRNVVRHQVLPALDSVSPGIAGRLVRLAELAREDDILLTTIARQEFDRIAARASSDQVVSFPAAEFAALPRALQRRIARLAIEELTGSTEGLDMAHVDSAVGVIAGAEGAPPATDLPRGLGVRREGRTARIYVGSGVQGLVESDEPGSWPLLEPGAEHELAVGSTMELAGGWIVSGEANSLPGAERRAGDYMAVFDAETLPAGQLLVRSRRKGDTIRPFGLGGEKTLQDLFVDAKIPRSLRERVAVLALKDTGEVLWVPGPGGRRSEQAPVTDSTRATIIIRFTRTTE